LAPAVKIGIGVVVGVGLGCILFVVATFIYLRRRLISRTGGAGTQHQNREMGEFPAQQRFHELVAGRGELPEDADKKRSLKSCRLKDDAMLIP
jgi:hypothetical protein